MRGQLAGLQIKLFALSKILFVFCKNLTFNYFAFNKKIGDGDAEGLLMFIQSKRVILKQFELMDYDVLKELMLDADVLKHTGFRVPQSEEKINKHFQKLVNKQQWPLGVWAGKFKTTHEFMGWFMLKTVADRPELGFMLPKKYWGRGLATEVSKAILDYAFEILKLPEVVAVADSDNFASLKILEKIGMKVSKIEADTHFYKISNPI